jgi:uncharacterized coiled-coil DUF342 family protein
MQESLLLDRNAGGPRIIESWVEIEIENLAGKIVTIRRTVRGDRDWRLVSTWDGPRLSDATSHASQKDFFVRDPGSAQSLAGFYPFLAGLLGWTLPEVPTYEGRIAPLYLEAIFPLLYVEQKTGWSVIQGPFPAYLRIQDVGRRSVEFLLDLDARRLRDARQDLEARLGKLSLDWSSTRSSIDQRLRQLDARVEGMPHQPTAEFASDRRVQVQVYRHGEWLNLKSVIDGDKRSLSDLRSREVPSTAQASPELEAELRAKYEQLDEVAAERDALAEELSRAEGERMAIQRRLGSLEPDLQKNKDALKLRELGSALGTLAASALCPTCHQVVDRELLPPDSGQAMGLEENIRFIESQLRLYRAMLGGAQKRTEENRVQVGALNREIDSIRSRVRDLKSALTAANVAPSEALVRQKVSLEQTIETYEALQTSIDEFTQDLVDLVSQHIALKQELAALPGSDFSHKDKTKVERLGSLVQSYLDSFGFTTYRSSAISISIDNFRPFVTIREENVEAEAELGFQMSASDSIRMKWAYYLGMFALGREFETTHPGFLILDEPRQQETERVSFDALITESANVSGTDRQIIFATSQTPQDLATALRDMDVNLLRFDSFILRPLPQQ